MAKKARSSPAIQSSQELAHQMADAFLNEELPECEFGAPKAGAGMWAPVVQIMDPKSGNSLHTIRLPQNEAGLSIGLARFMQGLPDVILSGV